jgi:cyclic pyranopterin phosphate synthase
MELTRTSQPLGDEAQSAYRMIDVGAKVQTRRRAVAQGAITMAWSTLQKIEEKTVPKGDVLALAEIAGILAAKKTPEILPLCHPLGLDSVRVRCQVEKDSLRVCVQAEAITHAKTGVEMEALMAVNAALLCIYDLVKGVDPVLRIEGVFLRTKEGGKSGDWKSPLLSGPGAEKDFFNGQNNPLPELRLADSRAAVITVSDRCSAGQAEDLSGPFLEERLTLAQAQVLPRRVVPDSVESIREAVSAVCAQGADLVFLTGGTGISPRDITPEALEPLWTKKIPGIGELLRSTGAQVQPLAWLSRSQGGLVGATLVISLPGSRRGVSEGFDALQNQLPHLIHIARGGAH